MPSKRIWLWIALSLVLVAAAGLFETGRLLFYSLMPMPEDHLQRALRVLAYQHVSCPEATLAYYSEGSITLQCGDQDATQYTVLAQLPCSETRGCRWYSILCYDIVKRELRVDTPT